jgi:hypothetical protein
LALSIIVMQTAVFTQAGHDLNSSSACVQTLRYINKLFKFKNKLYFKDEKMAVIEINSETVSL